MNKKIASFLLICICLSTLSGCTLFGQKKIARFTDKITRAATISDSSKELEVFDLNKDNPNISFQKSAIAYAKETAYVIPQTTGKVTGIKVKVGDKVKKGETIITLGDSLATDVADIQYQTALKALDLAKISELFTNDTAQKTIETSAIGVKLAYESYKNAQKTLDNAEEVYEEQLDSAQLGRESAIDARNHASDSLGDLNETIAQLEDKKDSLEAALAGMDGTDENYSKTEEALVKVEEALAAAKAQKSSAEYGIKSASAGIDQAENGIDILEESYDAQEDQLKFAVTAAKEQYDLAVKQFQMASNAANLQKLGLQTQVLQLDSATQIAALSNAEKNIKSPISGYITNIQAEENNFVATGQSVAKVENPEELTIKTSVNEDEASLLEIDQPVRINLNSKEITGKITAISPALSDAAKKINIEIQADNKENLITSGSLVKIMFSSKQETRIFIPLNSIKNTDESQFVTTVKDGKAANKEVKIGEIIGDYVEITSGLKGNEVIIKTANSFLNEGDQVTIK